MPNDTNAKADDSKEQNDVPDPLAERWLAFVQSPDEESAQNRFATELNDLIQRFLVAGSLREPLRNMREDLCQEAGLLLFSRLLAGNKELVTATRAGHRTEIAGQIRRSVSAALKFARWKLRKKSAREVTPFQPDEENTDAVSCEHPANFNALRQFPLDAQQKVVLDTLRKAVRKLHLRSDHAELARTLIEENVSQSDLAQSHGVTRQAINQRLKPVWRYLRNAIKDEEFPLS